MLLTGEPLDATLVRLVDAHNAATPVPVVLLAGVLFGAPLVSPMDVGDVVRLTVVRLDAKKMCSLTNRLSVQWTHMPPRRRYLSCCSQARYLAYRSPHSWTLELRRRSPLRGSTPRVDGRAAHPCQRQDEEGPQGSDSARKTRRRAARKSAARRMLV